MVLLGFTYLTERKLWIREGITIQDYEKRKEFNMPNTVSNKAIKDLGGNDSAINQGASCSKDIVTQ